MREEVRDERGGTREARVGWGDEGGERGGTREEGRGTREPGRDERGGEGRERR